MAGILRVFFFLIFNSVRVHNLPALFKESVIKVNDINVTVHLASPRIQKICKSRDNICKSHNTNVCTMRILNETVEYKDFENECYLFLSNMCDQPGEEYYIFTDDTCQNYHKANITTEIKYEHSNKNANECDDRKEISDKSIKTNAENEQRDKIEQHNDGRDRHSGNSDGHSDADFNIIISTETIKMKYTAQLQHNASDTIFEPNSTCDKTVKTSNSVDRSFEENYKNFTRTTQRINTKTNIFYPIPDIKTINSSNKHPRAENKTSNNLELYSMKNNKIKHNNLTIEATKEKLIRTSTDGNSATDNNTKTKNTKADNANTFITNINVETSTLNYQNTNVTDAKILAVKKNIHVWPRHMRKITDNTALFKYKHTQNRNNTKVKEMKESNNEAKERPTNTRENQKNTKVNKEHKKGRQEDTQESQKNTRAELEDAKEKQKPQGENQNDTKERPKNIKQRPEDLHDVQEYLTKLFKATNGREKDAKLSQENTEILQNNGKEIQHTPVEIRAPKKTGAYDDNISYGTQKHSESIEPTQPPHWNSALKFLGSDKIYVKPINSKDQEVSDRTSLLTKIKNKDDLVRHKGDITTIVHFRTKNNTNSEFRRRKMNKDDPKSYEKSKANSNATNKDSLNEKSEENSKEKSKENSNEKSKENSNEKNKENSNEKNNENSSKKSKENSSEKSKENSDEKKIEKSSEKGKDNLTEKSKEHSNEKNNEKSSEKGKDNLTEKSKEHSNEKINNNSSRTSKENSNEKNNENSSKKSKENSNENNNENSSKKSKENSNENNNEISSEKGKDNLTEKSKEHSNEKINNNSSRTSKENSNEKNNENSSKKSKENSNENNNENSSKKSKENSNENNNEISSRKSKENSSEKSKENSDEYVNEKSSNEIPNVNELKSDANETSEQNSGKSEDATRSESGTREEKTILRAGKEKSKKDDKKKTDKKRKDDKTKKDERNKIDDKKKKDDEKKKQDAKKKEDENKKLKQNKKDDKKKGKNDKTEKDKKDTKTKTVEKTGRTNHEMTKREGDDKKPPSNDGFKPIYDIEETFDGRICPLDCPKAYNPVCITANRGYGLYLKYLTFVNQCTAYQYYCKNWRIFGPPPKSVAEEEEENVDASPLSWSFCGSSRYLSFARFAEVASSMGYYGWLAGDYKATHIMEPRERIPGYGRKK